DAMDQTKRMDGPFLLHFIEEQMKLVLGHTLERLVLDRLNGCVLFFAAHYTQKINDRPHVSRNFSRLKKRSFINGSACDGQLPSHCNFQPPCTGGKSDTSSPSRST